MSGERIFKVVKKINLGTLCAGAFYKYFISITIFHCTTPINYVIIFLTRKCLLLGLFLIFLIGILFFKEFL